MHFGEDGVGGILFSGLMCWLLTKKWAMARQSGAASDRRLPTRVRSGPTARAATPRPALRNSAHWPVSSQADSRVAHIPVLRTRFPVLSLGYVAARLTEKAFIAFGIIAILALNTLRLHGAGVDEAR